MSFLKKSLEFQAYMKQKTSRIWILDIQPMSNKGAKIHLYKLGKFIFLPENSILWIKIIAQRYTMSIHANSSFYSPNIWQKRFGCRSLRKVLILIPDSSMLLQVILHFHLNDTLRSRLTTKEQIMEKKMQSCT
jgi:hypothetical protein